MTILIVDDNDLFIDVMREIVEKYGDLKIASTGQEAVDITAAGGVDLVFMDYLLPGGMTGLRAATLIRELPEPINKVPIVGVTGFGAATPDDAELIKTAGIAIELIKPILSRDIESAIEKLLHEDQEA